VSDLDISTILLFENFRKVILKIREADVLHAHHIKAAFYYGLINILFGKKFVFTCHGSYRYLNRINRILLFFIFAWSEKVVFVNRNLVDFLPKIFRLLVENKYEVVLNGVDLNYSFEPCDVRVKYGINKSKKIIFHPARFVREKNHLNLIRAFGELAVDNEDYCLVLAGDGPLRHAIVSLIDELGLTGRVYLLGLIERDDVFNFYNASDLFVMPSISEGLNVAFLEALSFRKNIVVSNIDSFNVFFEINAVTPSALNVFVTSADSVGDLNIQMNNALLHDADTTFNLEFISLSNMMAKYLTIYGRPDL